MDALESFFLAVMPWSFTAKTAALALMWGYFQFRTYAKGPVGRKINVEFRDQAIMSAWITLVTFILSSEIDATEVDWPFVTIALAGYTLWPVKTAWSHFDVFRTYLNSQKQRPATVDPSSESVSKDLK